MSFYSCGIKKYIPEGEHLYTGATLEIATDSIIRNEDQLKDELEAMISPEPNKKFLGMYLGLYYYYKNQKENPGFINRWLYKKLKEEPVYLSDVETNAVKDLLLNRLENRGFFYSSATSDIVEIKQKASVSYTVKVPSPYRMETYSLDSLPAPIHNDIQQLVDNTRFRKGIRFDLSYMKRELQRIDFNLKNKGYYNFDDSFLIFEADTNRYDRKRFDLYLKLKNGVPKKSIIPYRIAKVNIYPHYELSDTLQTTSERFNEKNYIQKELFFKPKHLDPFIKLEEGALYNPDNSRNTARRLSTIGAYKYVNIRYKEIDTLAT